MIADIALVLVAIYIATGVECCYRGPMARKREKAAFGAGLMAAVARKNARPIQLFAFRALLFLGIVFLWPVFLIDDRREMKAVRRRIKEHEQRRPHVGLTFKGMAGVGVLSCGDCHLTQEVHTATHGDRVYSKGYQCQTCGKFASRTLRFERTVLSAPDSEICSMRSPLNKIPAQYRLAWISAKRTEIYMIEIAIRSAKGDAFRVGLERELGKCREMLAVVPAEELELVKDISARGNAIDKAATAEYEASLFCECSGPLDNEAILFCPGCKSTNLQYEMTYIT